MAGPFSTAVDNPAVIAATRTVVRGEIVDRNGTVLATSKRDKSGLPYRVYVDDSVSPVIGYASRQFGTAGLERTYNDQLTGATGADPLGDLLRKFDPKPNEGDSLTLSLSLKMQRAATAGLGKDLGAVVMLDPRTGEILALASTPTFNASAVANPATSAQRVRSPAQGPEQPAAGTGHAGPVRAGIRLQDRDGGRGSRVRSDHAGDHVPAAAQIRGERAPRGRVPDP